MNRQQMRSFAYWAARYHFHKRELSRLMAIKPEPRPVPINWLSVEEFKKIYPDVEPIPGTIIAEGSPPAVPSTFRVTWSRP